MTKIAIYVEGGGDTAQQRAELRQGLDGLLKPIKIKAQARRIGWRLTFCGGRQMAYDAFINAVKVDPETVNVLLVDAEEHIEALTGDNDVDAKACVAHLSRVNNCNWDFTTVQASRVHLMVQCMEAWIVADPEAVAKFYGQYFVKSPLLQSRHNLEEEPKKDIYAKLQRATSNPKNTKGQYLDGKIKHASLLLLRIDHLKVADRCPRFKLLCDWLQQTIEVA